MQKTRNKEWAKIYLDKGLKPFPMAYQKEGKCVCGRQDCDSKHPFFRNHKTNYAKRPMQVDAFWIDENRNVGLNTGEQNNGKYLVVVDFDSGSDFLHFVSGQKWPETLTAISGSGSKHYYFYSDKPIKCSVSKVGHRVDIRGENGHIIAPPSKHISGNLYDWQNWGTKIAHLPGWLESRCELLQNPMAMLEKWARKNRLKLSIGKSDFSEDDLASRKKFDLEDIKIMLEYVDNEDYEVWYRVGAALRSEFDEDGLDVFVEWSSGSDKFKGAADCKMHYDSFRHRSDITIGTLVYYAKEGGWKPEKKPFDENTQNLRQQNMSI